MLIQSKTLKASDSQFKAAVADVSERLEGTKGVTDVAAPQISKDGHSALVDFDLKGDQEATKKSVVNSVAAVTRSGKAHPELRINEAGDASLDKAQKEQGNEQAARSLMLTSA